MGAKTQVSALAVPIDQVVLIPKTEGRFRLWRKTTKIAWFQKIGAPRVIVVRRHGQTVWLVSEAATPAINPVARRTMRPRNMHNFC